MAVDVEELLEDVQDLRHLRKDQSSVPASLKRTEQLIEPLELTTIILQESLVGKGDRKLHSCLVEGIGWPLRLLLPYEVGSFLCQERRPRKPLLLATT